MPDTIIDSKFRLLEPLSRLAGRPRHLASDLISSQVGVLENVPLEGFERILERWTDHWQPALRERVARFAIVITREMIRGMKPRSLIMDVSIDEGGCVETSRPTTHEHPTFIEEGVIHYCVPNIGSVVARTSTYAFLNAAFPYIREVAEKGADAAIAENPAIESAAIIYKGELRRLPRIRTSIEDESKNGPQ